MWEMHNALKEAKGKIDQLDGIQGRAQRSQNEGRLRDGVGRGEP